MPTRFQDLAAFTPSDVEAAIARNDPAELPLVPLTVALVSEDPALAEAVCIRLAGHVDAAVRGNALVSLGHLARRFRRLDEARVRPLLESGLQDADPVVRVMAKSACDEVHQFLHWTIAGHVYG